MKTAFMESAQYAVRIRYHQPRLCLGKYRMNVFEIFLCSLLAHRRERLKHKRTPPFLVGGCPRPFLQCLPGGVKRRLRRVWFKRVTMPASHSGIDRSDRWKRTDERTGHIEERRAVHCKTNSRSVVAGVVNP